MKNINEALEKFKEYEFYIENLLERKIKFIQTDNGAEFLSQEFTKFLT